MVFAALIRLHGIYESFLLSMMFVEVLRIAELNLFAVHDSPLILHPFNPAQQFYAFRIFLVTESAVYCHARFAVGK